MKWTKEDLENVKIRKQQCIKDDMLKEACYWKNLEDKIVKELEFKHSDSYFTNGYAKWQYFNTPIDYIVICQN